MSIIYPGNFVARLNAYKAQGVEAFPGVDFYSVIGVAYITGDQQPNDVITLKVPSPDLRQDDKPRLDKTMTVPKGALIYRSAINAVNCKATTGTASSVVSPGTGAAATPLAANVGCSQTSANIAGGGAFTVGAASDFRLNTNLGNVLGSDTAITAKVTGNVLSKGDDAANHSVVIVEIGYFLPHAAPGLDDVNLSFITETGSS
tara:strand:+ start:2166 stop:2774 length:609 start_codon:yes stop_codon:yes gene_type:complete